MGKPGSFVNGCKIVVSCSCRWARVALLAGLLVVALSACTGQQHRPATPGFPAFVTPPQGNAGIIAVGDGFIGSPDGGHTLSTVHATGQSGLNDVAFDFADMSGNGWAVGDRVVVSFSKDATTWRVRHVRWDLSAVAVGDSRHVWAGGNDGRAPVVVASADAGRTWTRCRLPHSGSPWVNDLAFSDDHNGWAVLEPDVLLHTIDGGVTWTRSIPLPGAELWGVASPDARHAWIVGASKRGAPLVAATADGGRQWRVQLPPRSGWPGGGMLRAVTFIDDRHGWAVGNNTLILATSDGGAHWRVQRTPFEAGLLQHVAFFDARQGWIANGGFPLLWTVDGGQHWFAQALPGSGYTAVAVAW